ncbi:Lumenal PsbP-like protein [Trebouxia sp. C0010 RCD-2024]
MLIPTLPFSASAKIEEAPPGYRVHRDKLDGYAFHYPQSWTPVSTSGNDIFYRNPYDVNECLFVNLSSPSSSKYKSVRSIGTPDVVAEKARRQYLREMMSTRLGVKRESDVVSSADRTGSDGNEYYDLQVRMKSYASRAQLAVTQAEIDAATELEWDRRLITVLGSANNRLYEFRLQTANATYEANKEPLLAMARSFACFTVDA